MSDAKTRCVAVIQCEVAHERCTGVNCARTFADRTEKFSDYGPEAVYYVPFPCGGCPGRRVGRLAAQLKRHMGKRSDVKPEEIVVHLSSCIISDNGHYPPCPHIDDMKLVLERKGLRVVMGTHFAKGATRKRGEGIYRSCDGCPT